MIKSAEIELIDFLTKLNIGKSTIRFGNQAFAVGPQSKHDIIKNLVYSECYALKRRYQIDPIHKESSIEEDTDDFQNELIRNNKTLAREEEGWSIFKDLGNGYLEVVKFQQKEIVAKSAIKSQMQNDTSTQKEVVTVHFSNGEINLQPNFYYVFGNKRLNSAENLVRIYWNIQSSGAATLVDKITTTLNHYQLPFLFKCLNKASLYYRRDPAVLYLESQYLNFLGKLLPDLYEVMKEYLEKDVPLFSYKYQPGIGMADSPNIGESFGLNRASLVAGVLVNSTFLSPESVISEIDNTFKKHKLNQETPHLKSGVKKLTL